MASAALAIPVCELAAEAIFWSQVLRCSLIGVRRRTRPSSRRNSLHFKDYPDRLRNVQRYGLRATILKTWTGSQICRRSFRIAVGNLCYLRGQHRLAYSSCAVPQSGGISPSGIQEKTTSRVGNGFAAAFTLTNAISRLTAAFSPISPASSNRSPGSAAMTTRGWQFPGRPTSPRFRFGQLEIRGEAIRCS